jgi:hypothetical protein
MTSTAPLTVPADPVVPIIPSRPSLSLVPAGAAALASRSGVPATASSVPAQGSPDSSAPAVNRPRFRRLVVFTGQLS